MVIFIIFENCVHHDKSLNFFEPRPCEIVEIKHFLLFGEILFAALSKYNQFNYKQFSISNNYKLFWSGVV